MWLCIFSLYFDILNITQENIFRFDNVKLLIKNWAKKTWSMDPVLGSFMCLGNWLRLRYPNISWHTNHIWLQVCCGQFWLLFSKYKCLPEKMLWTFGTPLVLYSFHWFCWAYLVLNLVSLNCIVNEICPCQSLHQSFMYRFLKVQKHKIFTRKCLDFQVTY